MLETDSSRYYCSYYGEYCLCLSPTAYRLLHITYSILPIAYCLLPIARGLTTVADYAWNLYPQSGRNLAAYESLLKQENPASEGSTGE